ncbi:4-aminobutyrate--2-oxoglutarate transaminase [Neorhizobium galegae]|uniref:4-aminobutyrate transaminase n=1 Tax=Neorhizobium galegae bv. orientalis str. HAMBI 540 TaxID=1028800 RepID=A0A068SUT8_NEOGA|nr:4-aminobutyrate--2-oxoglutarate transaminase [Neorhizobium galegae]MCQ1853746.1 4-aminobutyrate--2-oxoglutarate transaminase [Neorhizobium galegae]CDN49649.1 4-aminobutyrate transaminase [Neorhizobium galegae bv. orientalis str. HAMBI 540]CDZ46713.1 4-aminobutyrate transaminase [Neorhizobium galegae bv. orientalis]
MTVSADLQSRQKAAVAGGVGTRGIFAHKALNAELWDVDGRRFVDFAAGIAVNNTGHRHPAVMRAVAEQAEHFTHTCFHVAPYEGYVRLAERLNAMAPTGAENRTMLVTTGAEAVENAVKIARAHTGRAGIIAFSGAFHGRTMLGMALTGKVMPYKKNFGPFPADIYHAPFPNPYLGFSTEEAIAGLERLFAADVDPERIAAFIVEPVQGEGGFNVAPKEFLVHLRAVADKYGIVLIADEIQAGMARTGRMFGFEHAGVKPDMITMAKGLAGGFPLSAVTGKAEIMNAAHPGGLGGTYAGNPLSVAAANAVLDVIEDEKLCERAAEVGRRITERLTMFASRQGMEHIGDVRGLGAMVAFELVEDRQSKAAASALTTRIVAEAEARGLILLSCGTRFNVIRLLPPLTIEWEVLEEGLAILEASIEAAFSDATASAAA